MRPRSMYPYAAFNPALSMYNPYMMMNPYMGMSSMMGMHPMMGMPMSPFGMSPYGMHGMSPYSMYGMSPLGLGTMGGGFNPMLSPALYGGYSPAAGMQLDHSQATHTEALQQSQTSGGFSAGDAAWALRLGVEGLEWYGRRTMRSYPHLAHALRAEGALRAGNVLRGVGQGRPAAYASRVLGAKWSGRVGGWWANAAASKMVGQAGLRTVGNPAARAAMSGLDDVARAAGAGAARSTAVAARGAGVARAGTEVARTGTAVAAGGGRAAAATVGRGLGRLVPVMNVGIAALDGAQFVSDLRDPEASVARKITSGVTAGLSTVAATNIPVVSQVAGLAALGSALIRDLF
ncbi:MAG: hypothetical protein AAF449_02000 [Myxococcota bacterium]